jgi:holo-[acyl-carrier protein] synthase
MEAASAAGGRAGTPGASRVRGVGIDAVDIDRLRLALARRPSLAARLFTDGERRYAERFGADPAQRLAARFAAKEAAMKAFGTGMGAFSWRDVEVVGDDGRGAGAPALQLHGRAAALAAERGIDAWHLSLTHTDAVAMAMVVAEGVAP